MSAADVALTIGYTDYSTFYRAYSKHMGHPPNQDKSGSSGDMHSDDVEWSAVIPFRDPVEAMRTERALQQKTLPDIGFENNAYDPLDTF